MEVQRETNRTVRQRNRSALLTRLFLDAPLTRQDLARSTGLSQPAVSNVVGDLIDDGLVVEAGTMESYGGRPSMKLRVDPGFAVVFGVDVGEARIRVELFDLGMRRLAGVDGPIDPARRSPEEVVRQIVAGLHHAAAQVPPARVLGVGVGVPGIVTVEGGEPMVYARPLGWDGVPFERLLADGAGLPVHLDNGAKTLGQAEMWFGAGRGSRHAVFALVGSSVGAALVTNGATYRGEAGSAGEWGHTTLVYGGRPCWCGSRGCLEAYVGAAAIADRYREAAGHVLPGDEASQLTALLEADDAASRRVLEDTADFLGAGFANLINLFNPERIVLGGWAAVTLGSLLPRIRAAASSSALRQPYRQVRIELGELGFEAVALGAATLPIAQLLTEGGPRITAQ